MKLKSSCDVRWLSLCRYMLAFVGAVAVFFAFPQFSNAYMGFDSDSKHNFIVSFGLNEVGGVCDQCHAMGGGASDSKGFRWDMGGDDRAMCGMKCHNAAAPAWPTEDLWQPARDSATLPPKAHMIPAPYRCAACHPGSLPDEPGDGYDDYRACLSCHTTGISDTLFGNTPADYDVGRDTEVDKFFSGIGDLAIDYSSLMSQHNITYNKLGDLTTKADNECLKCHGLVAATDHPGGHDGTPLLAYPDDPDGSGALLPGSGIATTRDYGLIQDFCLSCHDGEADGSAVASDIQFNGVSVPAIPPKDNNQGTKPYVSSPPYLASNSSPPSEENYMAQNYFEINGHGRDSGLEGTTMNLTCLGADPAGGGAQIGCHTAHGSKNVFMFDDNTSNDSDITDFGTGINTPREVGNNVCLSTVCHNYTKVQAYTAANFHNWIADEFLHTGSTTDSITWWEPLAGNVSMEVNDPEAQVPPLLDDSDEMMPMFDDPDDDIRAPGNRVYETRTFGSAAGAQDGSAIMCLTCHDPHGTSSVYTDYESGISTIGMIRYGFTNDDWYFDPLCGYCHVKVEIDP